MIDGMKEESRPTSTFRQKAAEVIGDLLVSSADGSKGVCGPLAIAEPVYPIDLLMEDFKN